MKVRGASAAASRRIVGRQWRILLCLLACGLLLPLPILSSVDGLAQTFDTTGVSLPRTGLMEEEMRTAMLIEHETRRMSAGAVVRMALVDAESTPGEHLSPVTAGPPLPLFLDDGWGSGRAFSLSGHAMLPIPREFKESSASLVQLNMTSGILFWKDYRFAESFRTDHRDDWIYLKAWGHLLALSMEQDLNRKPHLQVQIPVGLWLFQGQRAAPAALQRSGVSCGHLRPLVQPLIGEQLGHSLSCKLLLSW
ncbi:MAG TPA: hypothetical protein VLY45_04715 [Nitrospiria bacterium]|nr:hypothetical protein [Nitrospiria bacterium]